MSRKKNDARPKPTGKQIRKAMIDLDISVVELANIMGVSAYYIRELYAERRKGYKIRAKIAQHLGMVYRKYNYQVPNWAKERVA